MIKLMLSTIRTKSQTTVWRFYALTFLLSLSFFSSVLVPFFTEWGHITPTQTQLLQSWFMLCIFILEIPTGAVADYLGRKYSIALGALSVACAALLYGSIPDFRVFLFAEFLFALGVALQSGADTALVYDSLKEDGREGDSKFIFGRAHAIRMSGFLISALVGSYMASTFGLNAPILFSSIPFIVAAMIALSLREPKNHKHTSESRRYVDIAINGVKYFLTHKKLRAVAVDTTIVASAAYFVIWLYQPMLQKLHVPIGNFGIFHAGLALVQIIIAGNFLFIEKRLGGPLQYLKLSTLMVGGTFILVALFPNIITLVLFLMFAGGFGLTRFEYSSSYMNKFIPSSERATVLSSVSMFRRLALIFLNPVVGLLAEGSVRYALFFVGIIPLMLLSAQLLFIRREEA